MTRSVVAALVSSLALSGAGCTARDGEGWAEGALGAAGAEAVRAEASSALGLGTPMPKLRGVDASKAPSSLPRPYVVFTAADDPTRPDSTKLKYHAMNKRVTPAPASAADVRAMVVLDGDTIAEKRGRRTVGHTEYDVYVVDRATKVVTRTRAASPEAAESALAALPP